MRQPLPDEWHCRVLRWLLHHSPVRVSKRRRRTADIFDSVQRQGVLFLCLSAAARVARVYLSIPGEQTPATLTDLVAYQFCDNTASVLGTGSGSVVVPFNYLLLVSEQPADRLDSSLLQCPLLPRRVVTPVAYCNQLRDHHPATQHPRACRRCLFHPQPRGVP